jgi:Reverse transcriptase (RNA-dependent DNA polymerase)
VLAPHSDRRAPRWGASPLWSNICLTPFDRRMTAEGFRLTRWADDFVGLCRTREEARRALAMAERFLREALGVERHPQKRRIVHVGQGVEVLGYKGKQGTGQRLPATKRRSRANSQNLYAISREKSGKRFQEQIRALTRRKVPLQLQAVSERITPVHSWVGTLRSQGGGETALPSSGPGDRAPPRFVPGQRRAEPDGAPVSHSPADSGGRRGAMDAPDPRSCPTRTPGRSRRGKRLAGKRHEPFERADGGRGSGPDLLRLDTNSNGGKARTIERSCRLGWSGLMASGEALAGRIDAWDELITIAGAGICLIAEQARH